MVDTSFSLLFAVLQRADVHYLAEHAAEVGGAGKAGLLGNRADGKLGGLQQLLRGLDAAGADVRRDCFRAMTPKGERDFTNLYAEFKSDDARAKWVVLISHYDTKPGCNCPGANDGASTSGLLVGVANAVSSWKGRKGRGRMR